jgi:hypothetical protein
MCRFDVSPVTLSSVTVDCCDVFTLVASKPNRTASHESVINWLATGDHRLSPVKFSVKVWVGSKRSKEKAQL